MLQIVLALQRERCFEKYPWADKVFTLAPFGPPFPPLRITWAPLGVPFGYLLGRLGSLGLLVGSLEILLGTSWRHLEAI